MSKPDYTQYQALAHSLQIFVDKAKNYQDLPPEIQLVVDEVGKHYDALAILTQMNPEFTYTVSLRSLAHTIAGARIILQALDLWDGLAIGKSPEAANGESFQINLTEILKALRDNDDWVLLPNWKEVAEQDVMAIHAFVAEVCKDTVSLQFKFSEQSYPNIRPTAIVTIHDGARVHKTLDNFLKQLDIDTLDALTDEWYEYVNADEDGNMDVVNRHERLEALLRFRYHIAAALITKQALWQAGETCVNANDRKEARFSVTRLFSMLIGKVSKEMFEDGSLVQWIHEISYYITEATSIIHGGTVVPQFEYKAKYPEWNVTAHVDIKAAYKAKSELTNFLEIIDFAKTDDLMDELTLRMDHSYDKDDEDESGIAVEYDEEDDESDDSEYADGMDDDEEDDEDDDEEDAEDSQESEEEHRDPYLVDAKFFLVAVILYLASLIGYKEESPLIPKNRKAVHIDFDATDYFKLLLKTSSYEPAYSRKLCADVQYCIRKVEYAVRCIFAGSVQMYFRFDQEGENDWKVQPRVTIHRADTAHRQLALFMKAVDFKAIDLATDVIFNLHHPVGEEQKSFYRVYVERDDGDPNIPSGQQPIQSREYSHLLQGNMILQRKERMQKPGFTPVGPKDERPIDPARPPFLRTDIPPVRTDGVFSKAKELKHDDAVLPYPEMLSEQDPWRSIIPLVKNDMLSLTIPKKRYDSSIPLQEDNTTHPLKEEDSEEKPAPIIVDRTERIPRREKNGKQHAEETYQREKELAEGLRNTAVSIEDDVKTVVDHITLMIDMYHHCQFNAVKTLDAIASVELTDFPTKEHPALYSFEIGEKLRTLPSFIKATHKRPWLDMMVNELLRNDAIMGADVRYDNPYFPQIWISVLCVKLPKTPYLPDDSTYNEVVMNKVWNAIRSSETEADEEDGDEEDDLAETPEEEETAADEPMDAGTPIPRYLQEVLDKRRLEKRFMAIDQRFAAQGKLIADARQQIRDLPNQAMLKKWISDLPSQKTLKEWIRKAVKKELGRKRYKKQVIKMIHLYLEEMFPNQGK